MTTSTNKSHKVSFATKFWYGAADIYGGGAFNIINFYYAFFLTGILRISPFWAALIIPISKVWDAVTDPVMGRITDNTRTRFGRRRIYFLIGVPLIFISFFLLWRPPGFDSQTARAVYALISYIIFCTVNTMIMVPYQAMMPELSDDYNERSSISGIRMAFSLGSSLVCALMPLFIVQIYPDDINMGYTLMGIIFGIFFALPFIGTFFFTREREEFMNAPKNKGNIFKDFLQVLSVKSFRVQILMFLCSFLALDVITVLFMYMMTYYMNVGNKTNIILGVLILTEILSIPLVTYIAKRTSKARAYKYGCIAWAILAMSLILITPSMGVSVVFVIAILMGCAIAFPVVMVYSIFSDVADIGELHFNKRVEGSFSGAQTFIRKTCSAIATGLVMAGLGFAGFVEPEVAGEYVAQSSTVIWTIRIIIAFVPAILLLLGARVSNHMSLTPENHPILLEYLEKKRHGEDIDDELSNKVDELKHIL